LWTFVSFVVLAFALVNHKGHEGPQRKDLVWGAAALLSFRSQFAATFNIEAFGAELHLI
jgi:hypothetical protein